jgi:hypothetical protein
MRVQQDENEVAYLMKLLQASREYYGLLAGNGKCSPSNKQMYAPS